LTTLSIIGSGIMASAIGTRAAAPSLVDARHDAGHGPQNARHIVAAGVPSNAG
jgi:hypothetical protein